jgi:hypothetical protein
MVGYAPRTSAARLLDLMIGEILKGCSTHEEAVGVDDRNCSGPLAVTSINSAHWYTFRRRSIRFSRKLHGMGLPAATIEQRPGASSANDVHFAVRLNRAPHEEARNSRLR